MRAALAAVLLLALAPAWAAAASPATIGYRGDASHDGRVTGAPDAPLGVLWAKDMGAAMSYPVVADGLVFVSVRNRDVYGTTIYALDATSGVVRWSRANPGTYWYGGMAYEQGRLFVLNFDGDLTALAAQTGAPLWSKSMAGQYSFDGPPVAFGGDVYVSGAGSGGTVYAVDGADGHSLWTASLPTGGGSPAVDANSVYISLVCEYEFAFARAGGAIRWQRHDSDCSGGGSITPELHQGLLYPFGDSAAILSATTGERVGTSAYNGAAGFADGRAFVPWNGGMIAVDAPSWITRWTYAAEGISWEAPLVADEDVYVAVAGGAVLALDRATGQPTWCASTAGQEIGGTGSDYHPNSHIGAGNGVLYVPAGRYLVAYGPGGAPALSCSGVAGAGAAGGGGAAPPPATSGPALTLQPAKARIAAGRRARLRGTLAGVLTATGAAVRIEADAWPFDGNWRTRATTTTAADGTFAARIRQLRNTRYRALASGLTSPAATVYADLVARLERRDLGGRRFRERFRISGPKSVRIAARRAHFYIVRKGTVTARRRATVRLRRVRPGVYVAAATLRYLRPRSATDVIACYRERTPDPWGPAYALDPLCGRRTLVLPAPGELADASARFAAADW
jgi:outer membrane protein assembly factor BamB